MQHLDRAELLKLLRVARAESQRDFAMILIAFSHGLRASEIVGRRTRLQGSYESREKAEDRRREFRNSYIRETTRKCRTGRRLIYQVITPKATFSGALTPEDFRDGYLTVKRLKGSNKTTHPLITDPNEPLLNEREVVRSLLKMAKAGEPLFPITRVRFWQIIQEYAAEAGIPEHLAHPHILKHSLGMQNIHQVGIENLRQYMGHKSGASTMEYLKVDDDQASQAIAAAMRSAG